MTDNVAGPYWEAYLRTHVRIDLAVDRTIVVEPGRDPVTDRWPLTSDAGWVITTCNLRSGVLGAEENAKRTRQLHDELAEAGYLGGPGVGAERSVRVDADCVGLGRRSHPAPSSK